MPYFRKKKKKVADKILPQRVCIEIINIFLAGCIFDTLSKQFGLRSGTTKHPAWLGSKLFDTLLVLRKDFFKIFILKKVSKGQQKHETLPTMQREVILGSSVKYILP